MRVSCGSAAARWPAVPARAWPWPLGGAQRRARATARWTRTARRRVAGGGRAPARTPRPAVGERWSGPRVTGARRAARPPLAVTARAAGARSRRGAGRSRSAQAPSRRRAPRTAATGGEAVVVPRRGRTGPARPGVRSQRLAVRVRRRVGGHVRTAATGASRGGVVERQEGAREAERSAGGGAPSRRAGRRVRTRGSRRRPTGRSDASQRRACGRGALREVRGVRRGEHVFVRVGGRSDGTGVLQAMLQARADLPANSGIDPARLAFHARDPPARRHARRAAPTRSSSCSPATTRSATSFAAWTPPAARRRRRDGRRRARGRVGDRRRPAPHGHRRRGLGRRSTRIDTALGPDARRAVARAARRRGRRRRLGGGRRRAPPRRRRCRGPTWPSCCWPRASASPACSPTTRS